MKRREFLKGAVSTAFAPVFLNGLILKAFASNSILQALTNASADTDHVLVMIQLNGGNDGLNMVIPIDQYSNLSTARTNILIPQNNVLPLNGITQTGLHPAMPEMQQLFNDGKLCIVQAVGYPNPNFSHFRATDIWLTGANSDQTLTTGWNGRYLNFEYPNYPTGYPNTVMPDPLAIQIGSVLSPAFQGPAMNMGMSITDPTNFYNLINGKQDPPPNNNAGKELAYVRTVARQTDAYATAITNAANKITTQGVYPDNSLADELKIVARLIAGGLKTRMYLVNLGSFDTHSNQVDTTSTTTGNHADLLTKLSQSVSAFMNDLKGLGVADRVVGMTFSEFGRRIKSNASGGTDHGAAAPLLVFGNKVISGLIGNNPVIPAGATVNDNIPMQYDFRSVYASLLQDWFCVSPTDLNTILLNNYQSLPLVSNSDCSVSIREPKSAGVIMISNAPNPFITSTNITFRTLGGHTLLQVFDGQGRMIKTLIDSDMQVGEYHAWFENEDYPVGIYYARLQNGLNQQAATMMIVK